MRYARLFSHLSLLFSTSLALSYQLWAPDAAFAAPSGDATRFLKAKQSEVSRYVKQSQKDRLKQAMEGMLDYEELSKRSLGDEWNKRKASERKSFVALLRQLVEKNYEDNIRGTLNYSVSYVKEDKKGEDVQVFTLAKSKKSRRSPAVSIDYSLRNVSGRWMIFDIVTDGVSLVENYRQQFKRILKKNGWKGLLERMEKKVRASEASTKT